MAVLAVAVMTLLAACATIPPNPLGPDARDGMFVRSVDVAWSPVLAKRFAARLGQKDFADVQPRLSAAVAATFKTSPSGSQAVDFKIEVTRYIPTAELIGDVSVVRASDGQVIGVYKGVVGIHAQGGGLVGALIDAAMKTDYLGIIDNNFAQTLKARFNG
jgi:hypothetical protein